MLRARTTARPRGKRRAHTGLHQRLARPDGAAVDRLAGYGGTGSFRNPRTRGRRRGRHRRTRRSQALGQIRPRRHYGARGGLPCQRPRRSRWRRGRGRARHRSHGGTGRSGPTAFGGPSRPRHDGWPLRRRDRCPRTNSFRGCRKWLTRTGKYLPRLGPWTRKRLGGRWGWSAGCKNDCRRLTGRRSDWRAGCGRKRCSGRGHTRGRSARNSQWWVDGTPRGQRRTDRRRRTNLFRRDPALLLGSFRTRHLRRGRASVLRGGRGSLLRSLRLGNAGGLRFGFCLGRLFANWRLKTVQPPQLDRHIFVDRAGVRLFFRDA